MKIDKLFIFSLVCRFLFIFILLMVFRIIGYERLLTALANCEFLMMKSEQAQEVNEAEILHYKELYTEIGKLYPMKHANF